MLQEPGEHEHDAAAEQAARAVHARLQQHAHAEQREPDDRRHVRADALDHARGQAVAAVLLVLRVLDVAVVHVEEEALHDENHQQRHHHEQARRGHPPLRARRRAEGRPLLLAAREGVRGRREPHVEHERQPLQYEAHHAPHEVVVLDRRLLALGRRARLRVLDHVRVVVPHVRHAQQDAQLAHKHEQARRQRALVHHRLHRHRRGHAEAHDLLVDLLRAGAKTAAAAACASTNGRGASAKTAAAATSASTSGRAANVKPVERSRTWQQKGQSKRKDTKERWGRGGLDQTESSATKDSTAKTGGWRRRHAEKAKKNEPDTRAVDMILKRTPPRMTRSSSLLCGKTTVTQKIIGRCLNMIT